MKLLALSAFCLLTAFSQPMRADVVTTYDITFTGTGTLPTSASFTYDSTVPQFSNFIVDWDGFSFNLTSEANSPYTEGAVPCVGSNTGAALGFAMLTTCNVPGNAQWQADYPAGNAYFYLLAGTAADCADVGPCDSITESLSTNSIEFAGGGGSFAVTAVAAPPSVPEPGTLPLSLSAMLIGSWVWAARRRARTDSYAGL